MGSFFVFQRYIKGFCLFIIMIPETEYPSSCKLFWKISLAYKKIQLTQIAKTQYFSINKPLLCYAIL